MKPTVAVCLFLCTSVFAQQPVQTPSGINPARHAEKGGVYLSIGLRHDSGYVSFRVHPLLDAAAPAFGWRDLEPRRGEFDLDPISREVERWNKAGKGVVIALGLYGMGGNNDLVPGWLRQESDVRFVSFQRQARGRPGRSPDRNYVNSIPAVWEPGFADKYLAPLLKAIGKRFDGHPGVWYVMPGFGHLGNLVCQPSPGGSMACVEAGWTPALWKAYCRRVMDLYDESFKETPPLVLTAGIFLRDPKRDHYWQETGELITEFGARGAAVVHYSLEADLATMRKVNAHMVPLAEAARNGSTRIGLGDDWPLWVPESRRGRGPTQGHDESYFRRSLEYAFGGIDTLPDLPTSILFCHIPELQGSHPKNRHYSSEVAEALESARGRLRSDTGGPSTK